MTVVPVILCGGSGTRLWPLSRALRPKQLLPMLAAGTLLQETCLRARNLGSGIAQPLIICNESQRFLVGTQLQAVGIDPQLVLEPEGRNTAPAAAVAALVASRQYAPDVLLLVLPSDHVIRDQVAFSAAYRVGFEAARNGSLVTFGILPDRPETGYGYIRVAEGGARRAWLPVEQFVEKPSLSVAEDFVRGGNYFWNSGMFMFQAGRYLEELAQHAPKIFGACERAVARGVADGNNLRLDPEEFRACQADSIDYAVMEHTSRAVVVPLSAGWSDVGSWAALGDVSPRDAAGNTAVGDVIAVNCTNSYLRAESRLVAAVGLDGCIVVETKDAVLVVPRDRAQAVKILVDEMKRQGRSEVSLGREVFRPWGSYDSVDSGPGFQVKRLSVLPGGVLSLQLHHRRAEHWVVTAGRARITRGEDMFELERGQHTFIPVETKHRIENPGTEMLHIVEVQIGDYLGEDDIVRFEDRYGRQGRTD